MSEKDTSIIDQIASSITTQQLDITRQCVKELKNLGETIASAGLLREVAEHCSDEAGASLVLLLVTAGADTDGEDGEAALEVALRRHLPHTTQALLQCGVTPPEALPHQCPEQLTELVDQFRPGLWTAVAEERLGDVRRLLNLWCRTDLCRRGQTLRRAALDTGNEPIISLILNIEPIMKCAFLVLARDEDGLAELLASPVGKKVNPNFRKQSERGAPLLYFAARSGSAAICRQLIERGATIGLQMRDEEGADMPLIFALLHPSISSDVIRCVLPPGFGENGCSSPASRQGRQLLQAACYRCRNVLTHAVDAGLTSEVLHALLQAVGPELVCERGMDNLCLPERLAGDAALLALLRATLAAWIGGGAPRDQLVPLLVRGCDWLKPLLAGDLTGRPDPAAETDWLEPLLAGDLTGRPDPATETSQVDPSGDVTVVGDAPQDRLVAGDAPQDRLVAGDAPQDRLVAGDAPQDRLVAGDAPLDRLVSGDAPQDRLVSGDAPQDRLVAGDAPQDRLVAGDAPQDRLDAGDAPLDRLVAGDAPLDRPVAGDAPQDRLVAGDAPQDRLVAGDAPQDRLVSGDAPQDRLVAGDAPLDRLVAGDAPLDRLVAGDAPLDRPVAGDAPLDRLVSGDAPQDRLSAFLQERRVVQRRVDALYHCLRQAVPQEELDLLADQLPDELLWHARPTGDGTPLLVLAALLSRPAAVSRLSRGLCAPDTVRDGFRRTVLHYACGTDCQSVRKALLKAGGSEHTLDVNGREPLDFTDVVGSERLDELLRMRRDQEYGDPEPDPWEPEHRRQLQERRRRQRFLDPALARHTGHAHYFPVAPGSDLRWPLPPDYSRASFAAAAAGGATVDSAAGSSSSCVVS